MINPYKDLEEVAHEEGFDNSDEALMSAFKEDVGPAPEVALKRAGEL